MLLAQTGKLQTSIVPNSTPQTQREPPFASIYLLRILD